jgi:hypothetical protein
LADGEAKKVFMRETLEKEVRLSYVERIQRTLPEDYFTILPQKPDIEDWKTVSGNPPALPRTSFPQFLSRGHGFELLMRQNPSAQVKAAKT